jgi:hypothetical protein
MSEQCPPSFPPLTIKLTRKNLHAVVQRHNNQPISSREPLKSLNSYRYPLDASFITRLKSGRVTSYYNGSS